jgi:hypothetical protein
MLLSRSLPRSTWSRRGDHHIGAAVDLAVLVVERHPADEQSDGELMLLAQGFEGVLHLGGEFPRRLEDQRARHSRPRPSLLHDGEHRQGEGSRLAGACLRESEHVTALERRRNGLSLNRSGGRKSCGLDRF